MLKVSGLEEFVQKDYAEKDLMHNLSHIRRILTGAQSLAQGYACDFELLIMGDIFMGSFPLKRQM